MARREATAEASLAAMRERIRLGMAIAAITKITTTTINSSIREKPVCFERICSGPPQALHKPSATLLVPSLLGMLKPPARNSSNIVYALAVEGAEFREAACRHWIAHITQRIMDATGRSVACAGWGAGAQSEESFEATA